MPNDTPIFIDFEASSLDLIASYPIEVGVCLADGEAKSWLITPHVLWKDWSERAARIHGISKDRLEKEGLPVTKVVAELNALLTGTVFCDAWTFDSFWLHRLFKAAKTKPTFELDSVASLLNEDQVNLWQQEHDTAIAELDLVRHRAANDALILHRTWQRLHQQG